ncbi:MAG: 2Fe-2S iron-sulfur cluster binding domain-containing protein, partial [Oscillospiraceae bacterium]|nr:2Fe-2S iron-sulfur cluster binding domain-containing protein [Oscillospiraceae bacterium]
MKTYAISFEPSGITENVQEGITLLEAARSAGIVLDSPCGGNGTCGKCTVKIDDGEKTFE